MIYEQTIDGNKPPLRLWATNAQLSSSQDLGFLGADREASCLSLSRWPDKRDVHPTTGEMKGVGYEIGKELARRLGIPYEPVIYKTPKLLVDDIESDNWDVAFIARSSSREKIMKFSETYLSLEQGFLVPTDSSIKTMKKLIDLGFGRCPAGGSVISRVAVFYQMRNWSIGMPKPPLMRSGAVDVFSANKGNLYQISDQLPGSRVLDGYFTVDEFALGIPIGRKIEMSLLNEFIEEIKSQGLIEAQAKELEFEE